MVASYLYKRDLSIHVTQSRCLRRQQTIGRPVNNRNVAQPQRDYIRPSELFQAQFPFSFPYHHHQHLNSHRYIQIMSGRGKGGKVISNRTGLLLDRLLTPDNRDSERAEQSAIVRFFGTIFKVSSAWFRHGALVQQRFVLRHYQACYSSSRSSWGCETYLWSHLRRDPWCPQNLP